MARDWPLLAVFSVSLLTPCTLTAGQSETIPQALTSDLTLCASTTAAAGLCTERLKSDIKALTTKGMKPLDRHTEEVAISLRNALLGKRLRAPAARLVMPILDILHSSDAPAARIPTWFKDAKAALDEINISAASSSAVIGSRIVISQDIRGPEDLGVQIRQR